MAWASVIVSAVILWAACGGVIAIGRRLWTLRKTLIVHVFAGPAIAFMVASARHMLFSDFAAIPRAVEITGVVVALDAFVVAPVFERSYAMFRSALGTWIPFAAIFVASWIAGRLSW